MKTNHSFFEQQFERRVEREVRRGFNGFFHFIFGAAFAAALVWVVMLLWNWLVPTIIGWQAITYWQALGLFMLCKLLFGSFGFKHKMGKFHNNHHKNHLRDKWLEMSEEERKEFIKNRNFRHKFGHDFFDCNENQKNEQTETK